jgi:hypothetical protein
MVVTGNPRIALARRKQFLRTEHVAAAPEKDLLASAQGAASPQKTSHVDTPGPVEDEIATAQVVDKAQKLPRGMRRSIENLPFLVGEEAWQFLTEVPQAMHDHAIGSRLSAPFGQPWAVDWNVDFIRRSSENVGHDLLRGACGGGNALL